jgi:hypothetical protein
MIFTMVQNRKVRRQNASAEVRDEITNCRTHRLPVVPPARDLDCHSEKAVTDKPTKMSEANASDARIGLSRQTMK